MTMLNDPDDSEQYWALIERLTQAYCDRLQPGNVEPILAMDRALTDASLDIRNVFLDAARYRWLRSRNLDAIDKGGVFAGQTPQNYVLAGSELDQAVDVAMAFEPGGAS